MFGKACQHVILSPLNGHVTEVASLKEGDSRVIEVVSLREREWSCFGGGQFNGHVREVASLMEGEWSCYRGGQFNGGSMVMLQRWSL